MLAPIVSDPVQWTRQRATTFMRADGPTNSDGNALVTGTLTGIAPVGAGSTLSASIAARRTRSNFGREQVDPWVTEAAASQLTA